MRGVLYASAVDSLMYVMVRTRPEIAHAVSVVSHFLQSVQRTLDSSEVDSQISQRHFQGMFIFWL